jgi:hypothetical protein
MNTNYKIRHYKFGRQQLYGSIFIANNSFNNTLCPNPLWYRYCTQESLSACYRRLVKQKRKRLRKIQINPIRVADPYLLIILNTAPPSIQFCGSGSVGSVYFKASRIWIRNYWYGSGSRSGSGSFHYQAKKVRKTLIYTVF